MAETTRTAPAAYTFEEAAELLRCSRAHLYRLAKAGHLKVTKIGHRSIIPATEIQRVLIEGVPAVEA